MIKTFIRKWHLNRNLQGSGKMETQTPTNSDPEREKTYDSDRKFLRDKI